MWNTSPPEYLFVEDPPLFASSRHFFEPFQSSLHQVMSLSRSQITFSQPIQLYHTATSLPHSIDDDQTEFHSPLNTLDRDNQGAVMCRRGSPDRKPVDDFASLSERIKDGQSATPNKQSDDGRNERLSSSDVIVMLDSFDSEQQTRESIDKKTHEGRRKLTTAPTNTRKLRGVSKSNNSNLTENINPVFDTVRKKRRKYSKSNLSDAWIGVQCYRNQKRTSSNCYTNSNESRSNYGWNTKISFIFSEGKIG